MELGEQTHRRYNPLTREWTLVSPNRTERPWQGQVEAPAREGLPTYDPHCYLCPGNERAGGVRNPRYESTFVFDNDFAALQPEIRAGVLTDGDLLRAEAERGVCRVVCFSPQHDLTLARMGIDEIRRVIDVWTEQDAELRSRPEIGYVQIFENRGEMMGCSNPHPHGQIWATGSIPDEPAKELASQREYFESHGAALLVDYLDLEIRKRERLVCDNDRFAVVVPFWAVWPFETLVLPKRPVAGFQELTVSERRDLGEILKRLTSLYDNLFQAPFPYSMGFHTPPNDKAAHPEWQFHAHFYPPLLRSATIRKFLVGFEMLGTPQRDTTPEAAAARLREAGAGEQKEWS